MLDTVTYPFTHTLAKRLTDLQWAETKVGEGIT